MASSSSRLTVLVPTLNRADTLYHCLRTIVGQPNSDLDILVSDNCSSEETKAVIDQFSDPRLRSIRPPSRLGMSEHWEFALNHVTSEWVTIVGDDDGLLPHAVDRFYDAIQGENVKAVVSLSCGFHWPCEELNQESRLILLSGKGKRKQHSRQILQKVLDKDLNYTALPCLYTGGFWHTDLIQQVKEKSGGVFYRSRIPDVYSGMVAGSILDEFLCVYEPLAIGGASRHSNGAQWMKNKSDQVKNMAFNKDAGIPFHPSLGSGAVQSLPIMVYESYLQAGYLRDFEVDTTTAKQLAYTILHAAPGKDEAVREYCRDVCALNGLDFDSVLALIPALKARQKRIKILDKIKTKLDFVHRVKKHAVNKDPNLNTIFDASQRAGQILNLGQF